MAKRSGIHVPDIRKWLARVQLAEKARDEADSRYGYSRGLQQYQGDFKSAMPSFIADVNLIPINEIYAFVKTFIPSVYSRDPHLTFNPKGANSIGAAKILELAINGYWRELAIKRQVRRCIMDAIFAEGWMKVGYTSALGSIEKEDGKPGLEADEFLRDEEIFCTRVSWKNMARDPEAVDGLHDARFVVQRIIKPLEAVVGSSLYTNTKNLRATHIVDMSGKERKGKLTSQETMQEYVVLYEIWDKDTEKVYAVSDGADDYLYDPKDWPYEMEGFPYALLRFNDNPDEAYAPNLIASWEPQLWEKMKIRSMQLDHIKRFGRQLWAKEGSIAPKEIEKFTLGKTGAINFYKGDRGPEPSPYPQIQTDMYGVENRIDLDKDNVSGQPNAVRSAPQRTQSRTLGEVDRLMASFQARQSQPQGEVEEFGAEIAYKLTAVIKQFLPGEKFVRASQKDIQEILAAFPQANVAGNGLKFTRADIRDAEFEIDVKSGSTVPLNRENRMDAMINLLKLGPTIGIAPGSPVSQIIGKTLVGEFELKEIELAYEREIAKLRAAEEVQKIGARAKAAMLEEKALEMRERLASGSLDDVINAQPLPQGAPQ